MQQPTRSIYHTFFRISAILQLLSCLALRGIASAAPPAPEIATDLNAWSAVGEMTPGINIGNTLDNTAQWETGWGNPPITKEFIQSLARLGFKTVRLPVSWDTFAQNGRIPADKLRRVGEVVDWINDAGMFCVINIHWDGGWIDSDDKSRFPDTFDTFSPEAEIKFRSYWEQISRFFAGRSQKLIFEALNEESNFKNEGSAEKAFATLTRVNQLFIDTVRNTGGNNATRLLIVAGYSTDIAKTCDSEYQLPHDSIPGRLFISVHYYTPFTFCGLDQDASWGKMMPTWGTPEQVAELNRLFDMMNAFCVRNHTPAFIGEFSVTPKREAASRVRWMTAVANAAIDRKMVPVLWDTGTDVSRREPYGASSDLMQTLRNMKPLPASDHP